MTDKIRVGVVGVGRLGQHHARNYAQNPKCKLTWVCDASEAQAKKIAGQWEAKATTNFQDLLGEVDAVSIATPTITHFDIGQVFLNAGVHCLIEKPIAATVLEAAKLSLAASNRNLILQVGHIEHFNVAVQKFKEILTTPRFIECHRLGPFDPRVKDVGVVLDLMIHDIDIILRIVKSPIESIEAVGVAILTDKEDMANARIRFKSGCIANVTSSRVTPKPMRKLRVFQDDAYISLDYQKQQMEVFRRAKNPNYPAPGEVKYRIDSESFTVKPEEPLKLELDHFLDCIARGREPQTTGEQAMEALDVVVKITEIIGRTTAPFDVLNPPIPTVG